MESKPEYLKTSSCSFCHGAVAAQMHDNLKTSAVSSTFFVCECPSCAQKWIYMLRERIDCGAGSQNTSLFPVTDAEASSLLLKTEEPELLKEELLFAARRWIQNNISQGYIVGRLNEKGPELQESSNRMADAEEKRTRDPFDFEVFRPKPTPAPEDISEHELTVLAEEWVRMQYTTSPSNRSEAERGIRELYLILGYVTPRVIWCPSPLIARLAQAILLSLGVVTAASTLENEIYELIRLSPKYENLVGNVLSRLRRLESEILPWMESAFVADELFGTAWDIVQNYRGLEPDWQTFSRAAKTALQSKAGYAISRYFLRNTRKQNLDFWRFSESLMAVLHKSSNLDCLRVIAMSAGWMIPCRDLCLITERPKQIQVDENMRLHNSNGPALEFLDGTRKVYRWHGIHVPDEIIEEQHAITVAQIEQMLNVEVRRVMIELYGRSRYLADCGAAEIHRDEFGILYRKEHSRDDFTIPNSGENDNNDSSDPDFEQEDDDDFSNADFDDDDSGDSEFEQEDDDDFSDSSSGEEDHRPKNLPLVFVKVLNATREKDGRQKEFFLRVPPYITTAREAVAWSFGLTPEEYKPTQES